MPPESGGRITGVGVRQGSTVGRQTMKSDRRVPVWRLAGRTDGRRSIIIRPLSVVVSLRWTVLNDIAESTGRKSVRRQANRYAVRPSSSALSTRNFLLLVRLRCSLLGPGRRLVVYRSLSGGLAITRPRRRRRQSNDLLFLPIGARDRIESKSLSD